MNSSIKKVFVLTCLISALALFIAPISHTKAQKVDTKGIQIKIFYSPTCPHCAAEKDFLKTLEQKYKRVEVEELSFTKSENQKILKDSLEKAGKEKSFGLVPATIVEDQVFIGFDNKDGIGADIEKTVREKLGLGNKDHNQNENEEAAIGDISVPLLGKINSKEYSLPALAVILGFLDGFNVCSLGALVLILGLVLTLGERKKILIYGGSFVFATALIYGFLILLWHQIFSVLSNCIPIMEALIATVGIGGGIYFFREFLQYRKYGPACNTVGSRLVSKLSRKVKNTIYEKGASLALFGGILAFAAVLTIIEFPCSAAVPVAFAGILAKQQLPALFNVFYIAVFVFFYMLDELILFAIATYKMNVQATSPKFTTWAVFVEALALTGLGLYYLWGAINCIL